MLRDNENNVYKNKVMSKLEKVCVDQHGQNTTIKGIFKLNRSPPIDIGH